MSDDTYNNTRQSDRDEAVQLIPELDATDSDYLAGVLAYSKTRPREARGEDARGET